LSSGMFIRPLASGVLMLLCAGPAVLLGTVIGLGFFATLAVAGTVVMTTELVNLAIRTAL
jgi:hypothetical protein